MSMRQFILGWKILLANALSLGELVDGSAATADTILEKKKIVTGLY
jgi:hypothetical protein